MRRMCVRYICVYGESCPEMKYKGRRNERKIHRKKNKTVRNDILIYSIGDTYTNIVNKV